ncbi:MAG TPA: response regulator [Luteimonas sp.]|nr:response regulator [Luteimonas sp.]
MKPRILLVEDDPVSRAFLLAATERLPAEVDAAGSVAGAIGFATRHAYALWLVDARLPDGSGVQLLQRLRAQGLSTPAIAHTASHERDEHDALLAAGFASTLAKPLPADAWTDAIRRALAGTAPLPAGDDDDDDTGPQAIATWDDTQALAALGGSAANVAALRELFIAELPGTRDAVLAAADAGNADAVREVLHRLRAGCGFVGAARLQACAQRLREAPLSTRALQAFRDAAQDTLSPS